MSNKKLYRQDAKGNMREWEIEEGFANDGSIYIEMSYGLVDGAKTTKKEDIIENMSGRDIIDQLELQFESRIKKMRDRGYVDTIEQAKKGTVNTLGLPRAMTATRFKDIKYIDYSNAYIQRKYDGNRCMIANMDGELVAYTRNGKRIQTIGHILKDIDIPIGTILDGELYHHRTRLQTLVSWIKRKQANTFKLNYQCYDMIHSDPFPERLSRLADFRLGGRVRVVPTESARSAGEALERRDLYRSEGYEGAIVRWGDWGYEDGKRSKSTVKLKNFEDHEFLVKKISPSKDGWAILHFEMPDGKPFKASAPGTMEEKYEVMYNKQSYIGKQVTVEYAYTTSDGTPFHPIAKWWREE